MVVRDFVSRAEAYGIDYNIVEAIDQPWKTFEGGVGPYWGTFRRRAPGEILLDRPDQRSGLPQARKSCRPARPVAVAADPGHGWRDGDASAAARRLGQPRRRLVRGHRRFLEGALLRARRRVRARPRRDAAGAAGRHRAGAHGRDCGRSPSAARRGGLPLRRRWCPRPSRRKFRSTFRPAANRRTCSRRRSIAWRGSTTPISSASLVINNTPDPALWQPVEEHCRTLGERFKFVRVDKLAGYKAGALRLALANTAADAEIIGVIDADYAVEPDWLKDLVPLFADPRVGLVQAPQDHRDGDRSPMHRAMNAEYAGFFDIGMVQRNEVNAIIVHGTMCLIRRAAIEAAGGWSSDTIVEDTDLGLTLLEHGWLAHYTNRRYGYGLLAGHVRRLQAAASSLGVRRLADFAQALAAPAARGGRPHARAEARIWPRLAQLARAPKASASSVALLNILWVPVVAFADIAVPDRILTLPILAAFVVSVAHFVALYRLRVRASLGQMLGAVCAAMSLQWTVARAVGSARQGTPAVPAHREGRRDPQGPRLPGILGGRDRRAAADGCARRSSSPMTSRCARSISSPSCWWCRACPSCRRSPSP